ncbi:uncharacterized protein LOC117089153 [Trachypithecus francoisi]|uniref:uncharacterized protein LOC117089153 n=1 Tax=Trachypithecus francoisi TaxID=54180 RepID=UPI00141BC32A|nr:uncharacterized protein LOC117089153 [Trachypithecus francoisi]
MATPITAHPQCSTTKGNASLWDLTGVCAGCACSDAAPAWAWAGGRGVHGRARAERGFSNGVRWSLRVSLRRLSRPRGDDQLWAVSGRLSPGQGSAHGGSRQSGEAGIPAHRGSWQARLAFCAVGAVLGLPEAVVATGPEEDGRGGRAAASLSPGQHFRSRPLWGEQRGLAGREWRRQLRQTLSPGDGGSFWLLQGLSACGRGAGCWQSGWDPPAAPFASVGGQLPEAGQSSRAGQENFRGLSCWPVSLSISCDLGACSEGGPRLTRQKPRWGQPWCVLGAGSASPAAEREGGAQSTQQEFPFPSNCVGCCTIGHPRPDVSMSPWHPAPDTRKSAF